MRRHRDTWKRSEKETWETMAGTLIWRALDRTLLLAALSPRRTLLPLPPFLPRFLSAPPRPSRDPLREALKSERENGGRASTGYRIVTGPSSTLSLRLCRRTKGTTEGGWETETVAWERNVCPPWNVSLLFLFLTLRHLSVLTFFGRVYIYIYIYIYIHVRQCDSEKSFRVDSIWSFLKLVPNEEFAVEEISLSINHVAIRKLRVYLFLHIHLCCN